MCFTKVNLPMGGRVQISKGYGLLNVDVMPSAYDFGKTQGLCGLLDGDRSNDRQRRNGSRSIDSNLSWR